MKRPVDGPIGVPSRVNALIGKVGTSHLRWSSIALVPAMLSVVGGFEVAVAVRFISGRLILPLEVILGGVFMSLLFLSCIKLLSLAEYARSQRNLHLGELLEREVVPLQTSKAIAALKRQTILVTGAAGSIGSELCRQLLDYEPEVLIALDTNETGLFDLAQGLHSHPYAGCLCPYIGDITDGHSMSQLFTKYLPQVIFHAAAYKHVPLLEQFPDQAVRTNILATFRLCRLAQEHQVTRFVFISTDKAAEPTGVMGATKRVGEMIVRALSESKDNVTGFSAVRFGNVIGSRGSVVPIFAQQIEQGGPITVTDPNATRYFMTIPEACGLVILAAAIANQGEGELYLLDMGDPVRIVDLAIKMARLHGLRLGRDISLVFTGLRPGERLHETLVASYEELIPTSHSKISSISQRGSLPALTTITQWMEILEHSLQHESVLQLREHLFEFVQREELIVSS
ncbi:MAG: SDR family NAD(P)-dependent oxidoreductase [Ktedonobacteraceae bacterium]